MNGFKINALLTRLADKVLNKIRIHIATLLPENLSFFLFFEAINVITPGNKQNYTTPKTFRFCTSPTFKQIITK